MSTENQPTEVEKSRLQPGGDIADANAAVKLMTTTGVPEIVNTFEEAGANYVTISILGGVIANAYQLVPATAEDQSAKWPTRDGYKNRFVTWGGQLHRLQGPPRRFKAAEGAPPDGARGAAEPAAPESEEEAAHPAPPPDATAGQVKDTGAPGEPDEGARAEDDDEGAEDGEDEPVDAGDGEETDSTGGAKTEAPAAAAAPAAAKAAEAKKDEPPRSYEWEETPVRLILHLRPNDGHELGREIWITGVTYDGDVPKAAVIREKELGELPPPVAAVVQNLKGSLPELREAHEAGLRAEAEKKRAEEERKLREKIKNKHKAGAKSGAAAAGARSKPAATPAPAASQAAPALPEAQDQTPSPQPPTPASDSVAAPTSDDAILNDGRPVIDATGEAKPEPNPAAPATTPPAKSHPQPRKPTPPAESAQGSFGW